MLGEKLARLALTTFFISSRINFASLLYESVHTCHVSRIVVQVLTSQREHAGPENNVRFGSADANRLEEGKKLCNTEEERPAGRHMKTSGKWKRTRRRDQVVFYPIRLRRQCG